MAMAAVRCVGLRIQGVGSGWEARDDEYGVGRRPWRWWQPLSIFVCVRVCVCVCVCVYVCMYVCM